MASTLWSKLDRRHLTQQYLYFLLRHRLYSQLSHLLVRDGYLDRHVALIDRATADRGGYVPVGHRYEHQFSAGCRRRHRHWH